MPALTSLIAKVLVGTMDGLASARQKRPKDANALANPFCRAFPSGEPPQEESNVLEGDDIDVAGKVCWQSPRY